MSKNINFITRQEHPL